MEESALLMKPNNSQLPADFCARRDLLISEYAIMIQPEVKEYNSKNGIYFHNYMIFCNAIAPKWDWLVMQIQKLKKNP